MFVCRRGASSAAFRILSIFSFSIVREENFLMLLLVRIKSWRSVIFKVFMFFNVLAPQYGHRRFYSFKVVERPRVSLNHFNFKELLGNFKGPRAKEKEFIPFKLFGKVSLAWKFPNPRIGWKGFGVFYQGVGQPFFGLEPWFTRNLEFPGN